MSITNTGKSWVNVAFFLALPDTFYRWIFLMINKVFNIRELAPQTDDRGKMFQLDVKSIRFDAENKLLIQ